MQDILPHVDPTVCPACPQQDQSILNEQSAAHDTGQNHPLPNQEADVQSQVSTHFMIVINERSSM